MQVCAVGGLLAVLAREGLLGSDDGRSDERLCRIADLSETSIDGYLIVDPVSQQALQIFQARFCSWYQNVKSYQLSDVQY